MVTTNGRNATLAKYAQTYQNYSMSVDYDDKVGLCPQLDTTRGL